MMGDHPRSRGDYGCVMLCRPTQSGSPPLTRGLRINMYHIALMLRITPAHAGTTNYDTVVGIVNRDHPRSRGDYQR